jgi:hypothetical protein
MNYLEQINLFWAKDVEYHFSDKETALYFYLLNTCNAVRWRNPFGLSSNMTVARFGWGKTSFERARNKLKSAGLIDFRAGIGRGNIYRYVIRDTNSSNQYPDEKDVQPAIVFDQLSGKGHEKDVSTDTFSDRFSLKGHEKGVSTDTFSDPFSDPESLKTEAGRKPLNNKPKYKLISKGKVSISFSEKGKSENPDSVKYDEEEKEKGSAQKEKEVIELYRIVCGSFPQILQLTGRRKEKILRRLTEMGGIQMLEQVFRKMEASDFLKGNNKAGWKATFDWIFENPDNWVKVVEGNYDNPVASKPSNDARFMGKLQTVLSRF